MRKIHLTLLLPIFILAGCGSSASDIGPGGVSTDDARALDVAAAKLDAQNAPLAPTKAAPSAKSPEK